MQESFPITPVYDLLLRGSMTTPVGLYHLHMATAAQLCRLHYRPGCLTTVKARLKTLVDHSYIQADSVPTKMSRSPYYYSLGVKGIRYLEETGMHIQEAFRASRETNKHSLFVEHTLELNDILIAAVLLHRAQPRFVLVGFIHERVFKRSPYRATWEVSNGNSSRVETTTLIPDAFLDFRLSLPDGRHRRMPILLEHDRGTEEQQHFRRRIRAYITLLNAQAYQAWLNVRAITIAFSTFVGEKRLIQMRDWTRRELDESSEPKQIGMTFCFAHIPQPLEAQALWLSPQWYTPYPEDRPLALLTN